ncbi:MAG: PIN domain-containing protein [Rubrivivax sp.]|nr:PIN domain-containing protein [Rubrivivax sp.]
MSADAFIDTNVFVYHLDGADPRKQVIAEDIVRSALRDENACISYQVVQECLNVIGSKARMALTVEECHAYIDAVMLPLLRVGASANLFRRALDVRARWQLSFYDALIVAAALAAGCKHLLSEDLQHGLRVESLTIVDPFRR